MAFLRNGGRGYSSFSQGEYCCMWYQHPTRPVFEYHFIGSIHHVSKYACFYELIEKPSVFQRMISMLKNLSLVLHERFHEEMRALVPSRVRLKVVAPPERRSSTWIGGSVLASLSSFKNQLISRQEYEEFGPGIVHRKCKYWWTLSYSV